MWGRLWLNKLQEMEWSCFIPAPLVLTFIGEISTSRVGVNFNLVVVNPDTSPALLDNNAADIA